VVGIQPAAGEPLIGMLLANSVARVDRPLFAGEGIVGVSVAANLQKALHERH
jgi:hypothetical protein